MVENKNTSTNKSSTEIVTEFAASLAYDDIPEEAIKVAKTALIDWLGVAIAGSKEQGIEILSEYARKSKSRNEASVLCHGFGTTAELAALVNGAIGHSIDFDDTFPDKVNYNIHPSTCVIPAVLSLAEKHNLSGRDVLKAYIAGMEVIYCVGASIGETNSKNGWHPTPVIGSVGTAAACANLLGLTSNQTRYALGVAASLAGGLLKNFGSMTKPMHAGNAARNGVIATELASMGFTSNDRVFDDEFGFCQMFGSKQLTRLINAETLGKKWGLISEGLTFKPYPSCRSTHSSIDATLYLKKEYKINPKQVSEITCKINPHHLHMARFHKPETGYQGKFSIPYCTATALRKGSVTLEDFTDDKVKDIEAQKLLSKVKFLFPDNVGNRVELAAEITIKLNNGTKYSHRVSLPKGEPENPITSKELVSKFEASAGLVYEKEVLQKVFETIEHLEKAQDLTWLFEVLRNQKVT